jgi:hypothetical protein
MASFLIDDVHDREGQSCRRASVGSIRTAFSVGSATATAALAKSPITATNVLFGSDGFTPTKTPLTSGVTA